MPGTALVSVVEKAPSAPVVKAGFPPPSRTVASSTGDAPSVTMVVTVIGSGRGVEPPSPAPVLLAVAVVALAVVVAAAPPPPPAPLLEAAAAVVGSEEHAATRATPRD